MKKNKINTLWVVFGLVLIYLSFLIYIWQTSSNMSLKTNFLSNKASAELDFFQDRNASHSYTWVWVDGAELYDWKWASDEYPLQTIYDTITVTSSAWPDPVIVEAWVNVRNIVRESH